jgi:hypothetical protein
MTLRKLAPLLLGVLLSASMAHAVPDWAYYRINVCNKGKIGIDVATVEKKMGDWVWSDSEGWKARGWMSVAPNDCAEVWKTQRWESGFTVHRPAVYLVVTFTDSTGAWGRADLELTGTKLADKATDQEICVKTDAFDYDLPSGKISGECKAGYQPMRASFLFDPAPGGMIPESIPNMPLVVSGPYELNIELNKEARAIKFGELGATVSTPKAAGSGSSTLTIGEILAGAVVVAALAAAVSTDTPKPFARGTLNASLLGKKIVRYSSSDSDWYYEDGSHVNPAWGLNGKTGSWLMDAPGQHPTSDPEVVAAFGSLRQALANSQYNRRTQIEPTGRLSYSYIPYDASSEYLTTVNLSALDYKNARPVATDGRGVTGFMIPCKELQLCVGTLYEGKVKIKDKFYLLFIGEGDAKAETVWRPLMKLVDLYPAEPAIAVR